MAAALRRSRRLGWQPPAAGLAAATAGLGPAAWAYPQEPDNGAGRHGLRAGDGLARPLALHRRPLVAGLASACAIAGLVYSRKGKRKVAAGETRKHKGLAQAGFISSIVMIVLATLATIAWTAFWIVFATDEEFRDDLDDSNGGDGISAALRLGVVVVRLAATLLS